MKNIVSCILLAFFLQVSENAFCTRQTTINGELTRELNEDIDNIVSEAKLNNDYSKCNQCMRDIKVGEECLEWTDFHGTIYNITFCNELCFTEAKVDYPFLDKQNFGKITPERVVITVPAIFKMLTFMLVNYSFNLKFASGEPINDAKYISDVRARKNKNHRQYLGLFLFNELCSNH